MPNKTTAKVAAKADQDLKSSLNFNRTRVDRLAIFMAGMLGSMQFLIVCLIIFTVWIGWNLHFIASLKPFDPFPFPILEMTVSLFAIILSVAVLINQNRQGRIDKIAQQIEFEVNVRAESEVTKMLNMLHDIHLHLGIANKEDKELEKMKEQTDIDQIHETLDKQEDTKL